VGGSGGRGAGGGAPPPQLEVRIGTAGLQSAVNHDGGGVVPAEEVNGDPRGALGRPSVGSGQPGPGGDQTSTI
jgi:hypothetical protein